MTNSTKKTQQTEPENLGYGYGQSSITLADDETIKRLPKEQIEAEFLKDGMIAASFTSNDNVRWWDKGDIGWFKNRMWSVLSAEEYYWWLKGFEMATTTTASRLGLTIS